MKYIIASVIIVVISFSLFAQDTLQINTPPIGLIARTDQAPPLSMQPSAQDLADLFVSACGGEMNPMDAVALATSRGENAIPGLAELLFGKEYKASKSRRDIKQGSQKLKYDEPMDPLIEQSALVPNKLFVVLALETIGTPEALALLLQTAESYPFPEIRGVALDALNNTFYTDTLKLQKGKKSPDKTIIRILINNADDTTYVGYLQKRNDQIAQEGLMRWLGKDFGDPQFDDARTIDKKEIAVKDFRKKWLKENEAKLKWNKETRHFEVEGE